MTGRSTLNIPGKLWLSAYFVFFFFLWGIFLPFWGTWLADKGVSPEQIGTLFSLGLVLRFASNLGLLPRIKSVDSTLKMVSYLSLSALICFLLLVYFQGWYTLAALTLILNFLLGPMIPLGDIIGTRLVKQININYGQVRLWGSVSFIAGSACVGWTIIEFGYESILWLMIIAIFLLYGLSLTTLTPQLITRDKASQKKRGHLLLLLKQPKVLYFLLIMGTIQGSHSAYYAFSALYWDSVGISSFNIALLWGIGVLAEVLLMRFNEQWFARWSIKQMVLLALIAGVIRWLVLAYSTDLWLLMIVQTFHAFTFALAHLAAMRYIAKQPEQLMVSYQTLYSGVGLGLMMAAFTYLSGWIYMPQQSTVFLWMACALLPVFVFIKKWHSD